jgi:hypothetical protein
VHLRKIGNRPLTENGGGNAVRGFALAEKYQNCFFEIKGNHEKQIMKS